MIDCKKPEHEFYYHEICLPCIAEFVERLENEKIDVSFAKTITKLAKERDLYNARRKEAMVICEKHRNEKNKYKKALLEIKKAIDFFPNKESKDRVDLAIHRAFGGK